MAGKLYRQKLRLPPSEHLLLISEHIKNQFFSVRVLGLCNATSQVLQISVLVSSLLEAPAHEGL